MQLAHKIEIKPTEEQAKKLECACGCARFAYNWGLAKWKEMYEEWKKDNSKIKPNIYRVRKEFNNIKKSQFPWIYDSPKDANQQAFFNLGFAFKMLWKKVGKYPKFKSKKSKKSFYVGNDRIKINGNYITLPKIGVVKMTEILRFNGKIMNGVVSKVANKWFISILVDTICVKKTNIKNKVVGIDMGLKNFATLSTGEKIEAPQFLRKLQKKLSRRQKQNSRKKFDSNNRKKSNLKLSKIHYKIWCKRNDFLHKLSHKICRENQMICLEDLAIKNMKKNRRLATSIGDAGWAEFKRQIKYKSKIFGNNIFFADKFFASSKICSNCGYKKQKLLLSERVFVCDKCKSTLDRDINAAINLSRLGHSRIYACGHETSTNSISELASIVDDTRTQMQI